MYTLFKSDLINNMDHMRISGIESSHKRHNMKENKNNQTDNLQFINP